MKFKYWLTLIQKQMRKKLIFGIRDGDVSFFTSAIKYEEFTEKYVKDHSLITGIIFNQKGSPSLNIPLKYWYTNLNYRIKENSKICKLLKNLDEKTHFFPAIHGYDHNFLLKENKLLPELRQINSEKKLSNNLEIVERFFLETFKNPQKLFIPPSNTLSAACSKILFKRRYSLFNYPGIMRRSRSSIRGYNLLIQRILHKVFKRIDLQKPYMENSFSKCFNSIPLTSIKNQKHLIKLVNHCSDNGYPFLLSMHQWELECFKPYSATNFLTSFIEIVDFLEKNFELVKFNPDAEILEYV